jgi:hypothetical protein
VRPKETSCIGDEYEALVVRVDIILAKKFKKNRLNAQEEPFPRTATEHKPWRGRGGA